ncbi:MAG: XTP/dITP diphosphatase [Candidatus Micrarchaeota archaeon]|nr:XTP/dITP diphosphatase [Candidatus Micrarchaeota archaeon]
MKLLFATHNKHKLEEAREILGKLDIEIEHFEIEYDEPRGEDTSEIAEKSARDLFSRIKKPLFLDDSGIFVNALNGFPGPYSAWVFRKMGYQGILKLLDGNENRKAYFKSSIAYASEKGTFVFDGIMKGSIPKEARGDNGFGYDPIVVPEGMDRTFAEMSDEEKNSISHRKIALHKFADFLSS